VSERTIQALKDNAREWDLIAGLMVQAIGSAASGGIRLPQFVHDHHADYLGLPAVLRGQAERLSSGSTEEKR
jgi:hypothetical protein